ncbi:MAG TPA: hypothetical protein VJ144_02335, partial [Candidatus Polarisedimenticolia bacterium]|nr:hypothetical protein [Candidatus Polarisedimenticolia bacterium]
TLDAREVEDILHAEQKRAASAGAARPDLDCRLVGDARYDAVAACDAAVAASGTATLETALLGVPMVIIYRMNPLTFALARLISNVPHVGMSNLIAGGRIVPELVQGECTPERIALELRRILTDLRAAGEMRTALSGVRSRLGRPGAIDRVAAAAWDMIGTRVGERAAGGEDEDGRRNERGTRADEDHEHDRLRPGGGRA